MAGAPGGASRARPQLVWMRQYRTQRVLQSIRQLHDNELRPSDATGEELASFLEAPFPPPQTVQEVDFDRLLEMKP